MTTYQTDDLDPIQKLCTHGFVKLFCRKMRHQEHKFILDGFDSEFYFIFDCEIDPELPSKYRDTCDILLVPIGSKDSLASAIRIVANANKFGVMRMLTAIGINRFDAKVKKAFYDGLNILRTCDDTP